MSEQDLKPWDRQQNETASQFAYFQRWLGLGRANQRRIPRLVEEMKKLPAQDRPRMLNLVNLRKMAVANSWTARGDAWDDYLAQVEREEELAAVREMRRRHARDAMRIQERLIPTILAKLPSEEHVERLYELLRGTGADAAEISNIMRRFTMAGSELAALYSTTTKTETLARGDATESTVRADTTGVSAMTADEAREYAGLED